MKTQSLIIIWICLITTSCGLVSKYQSGQHSVYAGMLTQAEKDQINQAGEIIKEIELGNPAKKSLLKGTLRIIKTEKPDVFNFVEIEQWIDHGRYGNSGLMESVEFRDTTVNDYNGNTISRRVYDMQDGVFVMVNDWTSETVEGSFVQHFKVYERGILRAEYSTKVVDYLVPKSDIRKKKIQFGIGKGYFPNGKLGSVRTYDQDGKLISEEKYAR